MYSKNSQLLNKSTSSLIKAAPALAATQQKRGYQVIYGDTKSLPNKVRHYVEENARLCKPDTIHICDGSEHENNLLMYTLQRDGLIKSLPKYDNWYEFI